MPVYPTHGFGSFCSATPTSGSSSTIGAERASNIALTSDEDSFVKELIAGLGAYPRYYAQMGPANRRGPAAPDLTAPPAADPAELRRRIRAGEWVVDLRQRRAFAGRHLAGSISVELGDPFATYLGWTMAWGTPLTLIGDSPGQVARAQRELARIGIDQLAAAATGTTERARPPGRWPATRCPTSLAWRPAGTRPGAWSWTCAAQTNGRPGTWPARCTSRSGSWSAGRARFPRGRSGCTAPAVSGPPSPPPCWTGPAARWCTSTTTGSARLGSACRSPRKADGVETPDDVLQRWVKVIDQDRCIGCHACTTACKSENEVPLGVTRTYVKSAEVGTFPQVRRAFQVTRCNQCADAPCVAACPTQAMYRRPDGIVDFDKQICVGCKACIAACPYDAIFINPEDNSAEKCNLCAHRLEIGLEPACVTVCPTEAILVGDLNDPGSKAAQIVNREPVTVRKPEKGTRPGLFYKGAHQATLDPLAARRPDGGLFAWATQGGEHDPGHVTGGHPGRAGSSAEALLSYDVGHHAPWGWRVSLYTWTKGVAAGALLVPLILILAGRLSWDDPLARWAAPALALAFLGLTGILLIWDLRHPWRFYLIFTRPHWRSWLVRGAFIIGGYGAAAALFLLGSLAGAPSSSRWPPGSPGRSAWPPRSTPRTCSPRPGRGTCGRARCWRRTWRSRRCWPGRP